MFIKLLIRYCILYFQDSSRIAPCFPIKFQHPAAGSLSPQQLHYPIRFAASAVTPTCFPVRYGRSTHSLFVKSQQLHYPIRFAASAVTPTCFPVRYGRSPAAGPSKPQQLHYPIRFAASAV